MFNPISTFKWFVYRLCNRVKNYHDFKSGDVLVWDPPNIDRCGTKEELTEWYGPLGYGKKKRPLFVYICPINACGIYHLFGKGVRIDSGHCILIELGTGRVEWMRHPDDFRFATDEEF